MVDGRGDGAVVGRRAVVLVACREGGDGRLVGVDGVVEIVAGGAGVAGCVGGDAEARGRLDIRLFVLLLLLK